MYSLILASLLLSSGPLAVHVHTLDGQVIPATLSGFSSKAITVQVGAEQRELSLLDVARVEPTQPRAASRAKASVWIDLVDGSRLLATRYEVASRKAMVDVLGIGQVEIPTRSIAAVLFQQHLRHPELEQQWHEIVDARRAGDTVVVRRKSEQATGEDQAAVKMIYSLDSLDGVLHDITADSIHFQFDGQRIPLPRAKVEGIVYYHALGRELPQPVCLLTDADGSKWQLQSLSLDQHQQLHCKSVAGVESTLPVSRVARWDFSAMNTTFLSELRPIADDWQLRVGFGGDRQRLRSSYRQFSDAQYEGDLQLFSESGFGDNAPGQRTFEQGIALPSRSARQYLLGREYRRLRATVGIDARYRQFGKVRLTISGDDRVLLDREISGADREPIQLDLDVSNVRRLSILVDHAEGTGIGDRLNFCNARLTK